MSYTFEAPRTYMRVLGVSKLEPPPHQQHKLKKLWTKRNVIQNGVDLCLSLNIWWPTSVFFSLYEYNLSKSHKTSYELKFISPNTLVTSFREGLRLGIPS